MKIKVHPKVSHFLNSMSNEISPNGDKPYQFLPYWFRETEEKNEFEAYHLDELPKELKDAIEKFRERPADDTITNS